MGHGLFDDPYTYPTLKMFDYDHVHFLERDLEIPMYSILGMSHISAKVSQAILAEVIHQIAKRKRYPHENMITRKARAFLLDQALKSASLFSALGGSSIPSTIPQSC